MLILINMDTIVMELDSMHVQNFYGKAVTGIKMLFLQLIIVILSMLLIKNDTLHKIKADIDTTIRWYT